jgi:serine O-acetyltransferase
MTTNADPIASTLTSPAGEPRAGQLAFEHGKPLATGTTNENPRTIGFAALIREDFRTHGSRLRAPGFWALLVHRFGNLRMSIHSKPLRAPVTALYRTAHRCVIALWGIDLPYNAKLGRRLRIEHHGCVIVGAQVVGDDVCIRHSVTIGLSRRTDRSAAPTIGNRVEIAPGACIVGAIHVGDDSYIGANSVLADSVPAGSTVLGVPARQIRPEPPGAGAETRHDSPELRLDPGQAL